MDAEVSLAAPNRNYSLVLLLGYAAGHNLVEDLFASICCLSFCKVINRHTCRDVLKMSEVSDTNLPGPLSEDDDETAAELLEIDEQKPGATALDKPRRGRPPSAATANKGSGGEAKPEANKVVKLLDKNPLGMTLPEMAGGTRQIKRIKTMRPLLAEAIRSGLVMPVSQRAGHTVYRLVKHIANR